MNKRYDLAIIGGGASGLVAAIAAARRRRRVVLCEKMSTPGLKLLASGGQRCNLTNTLSPEAFMERFGREGRFMGPALAELGGEKLRSFFHELGIETDISDGFRVWPATRRSETVLAGLLAEARRLGVRVELRCEAREVLFADDCFQLACEAGMIAATELILATGGLTCPRLGTTGDGYKFARAFGHRVKPCYPGGVPLLTRERWPGRCTAHTIGKAVVRFAAGGRKMLARTGDVIFTERGIAGPVILDLSREISPLLEKHGTVSLRLNLGRGRNREDWQAIFKEWRQGSGGIVRERLAEHFPPPLAEVLCELAGLEAQTAVHALGGEPRDRLIGILVETPLTVVDTAGYDQAFITRGGVSLKEVDPNTLESRLRPGLYLCGELLDLDGPCGGFNLQWAFASGYLAGLGK
ncbi:MAG: aminoacetone oxidase family FAD-binding enzyme [Elusimicrobia bacterium]|nr:aminoacetone oxidase family FAD-binding enzyme [Elusimicrobiota bacterium]